MEPPEALRSLVWALAGREVLGEMSVGCTLQRARPQDNATTGHTRSDRQQPARDFGQAAAWGKGAAGGDLGARFEIKARGESVLTSVTYLRAAASPCRILWPHSARKFHRATPAVFGLAVIVSTPSLRLGFRKCASAATGVDLCECVCMQICVYHSLGVSMPYWQLASAWPPDC